MMGDRKEPMPVPNDQIKPEPPPAPPTSSPDDLDIRFVGELQRLEVKPGDRFVLTSERHITPEMADRLRQSLSQVLGGAPVLVLSDGLKLGAVSGVDSTSEDSPQAEGAC